MHQVRGRVSWEVGSGGETTHANKKQKVAFWACYILGYWPEELIYIINHHHAMTSGLYRWTHIVDTPVSRESRHSEVPRGQKWPALLVVLYLCTFFACFCIIDVWQCVKRHHVIMRDVFLFFRRPGCVGINIWHWTACQYRRCYPGGVVSANIH